MAAVKRTKEDLEQLNSALENYKVKLLETGEAVEEDLLFHIKIAEASKNSVLKSLMMIITPDIVNNFIQYRVCDASNTDKTIEEHKKILEMISNQDAEGAVKAMDLHLADVKTFSNNN